MNGNPEWLRQAARCYLRGGLLRDAARTYQRLDMHRPAAELMEQLGEWEEAATLFAQIPDWLEAARCYEQAGHFLEAARCHEEGEDRLMAAWILAHHAHRFDRAVALLSSLGRLETVAHWEREVILARCLTGEGKRMEAGLRLEGAVRALFDSATEWPTKRLAAWIVLVADLLQRFDLSALAFASRVHTNVETVEHWEHWAMATLGDMTGIPHPSTLTEAYSIEEHP